MMASEAICASRDDIVIVALYGTVGDPAKVGLSHWLQKRV